MTVITDFVGQIYFRVLISGIYHTWLEDAAIIFCLNTPGGDPVATGTL